MTDKLYIIDGHALIFKMYYAFQRRPMINSKGADTSILYGFTKYVLELLEREKPTHLAVSFDPPGGTFRNDLYPDYKANRSETPQLVIDALEPLMEICRALNIPVYMIRGYEADDVIGTLAHKVASDSLDVYMVTPDKDYGQLVSDHIFQYKPGKGGGEAEILGPKEICEKYEILDPVQVIDMLTLCGDAADNVPGVNGVGEVSAKKLISLYGSVENIYANLDSLTERQKAQFDAARDYISLSKKLVTIKTDVPVDASVEDMLVNMSFSPDIADLFEKYEFDSLKKNIHHIASTKPREESKPLEFNEVPPRRIVLLVCVAGNCALSLETEGTGIFASIRSICISTRSQGANYASRGTLADFRRILEDPTITKYGVDLKYQMNVLAHAGVALKGRLKDVELMHYLIDPEKSHSLSVLAKSYLGVDIVPEGTEVMGSLFDDDCAADSSRDSLMVQTAAMIQTGEKVWSDLHSKGLTQLYEKMEEPLLRVLSGMERRGVRVDVDSLKEFAFSLRSDIERSESIVREIAGDPALNVASPKQIGELIFERLKLDPKAKKSGKGGWSTDEATLLALSDKSPVIAAILEYRAARKLLSTYIEPLPGNISPLTGRVHTTFNQALTSTGRLSSSNPNLQNIPVRTERGQQIRKAFVAQDPLSVMMSADYSQIELRIMAHLSCDAHLLNAFREGVDVHVATASKIFGVGVEEVTAEQRRVAKTANFGIMYGISSFGLAQRLGISRGDAKKIIDDYFASFPSISSFIESTLAAARETSYVETLFGRRRYIPDINSHNATIRSLAERNAVNAPIQGTAADIIKMAMIAVEDRLQREGLAARMVLQIHDELLLEVPFDEIDRVKEIVVGEMENVAKLSVPLTVECNYGKNWLEAH